MGILVGFAAYGRAEETRPLAGLEGRAISAVASSRGGRAAGRAAPAQVSIIGSWTGPDLDAFWALAQPFAQRQGVKLSLESTPDVASVLSARVAAGEVPDVAILPGVGLVRQYAQAGDLVPLQGVLDADRLAREYPAGWLEALSVDGRLYGAIFRLANESLVWYNPGEFQRRRWTVPLTWDEMIDLGERIARRGLAPWSVGLECRSGDGEPGTDWIENILLRLAGGEAYDRWVQHRIPWTDKAVREAFLQWGKIVGRPRNLCGGPQAALRTDSADAVDALYQDVPAAYLYMEGSFVQPLIARRFPHQVVGRDYDCFALPPMSQPGEAPVLAGADTVVLFNPTPQAEALVRYLTSREAQVVWLQRGGSVAPNAELDLDEYPDPLSRRAARQLVEAETVRFDASQQMPAPVADAFRQAVREYVANPGRLDSILAEVERVAEDTYGEPQSNASRGASRAAPGAGSPRAAEGQGRAAWWNRCADGCLCEGLERSLAKGLDVLAPVAGGDLARRLEGAGGEPAAGARGGAPEWPAPGQPPQ